MIIEFSESDLLASKLVTPSWYRVLITSVEDKVSNDGQSTNSWIKGKIICDADSGSEEFAGVPTPFLWMINSKGAWAAVGLMQAVGMEVKPGQRADLSALAGRTLDVFIENDVYKGVQQNAIKGKYRASKVPA